MVAGDGLAVGGSVLHPALAVMLGDILGFI